jgi:hypothetical protein
MCGGYWVVGGWWVIRLCAARGTVCALGSLDLLSVVLVSLAEAMAECEALVVTIEATVYLR